MLAEREGFEPPIPFQVWPLSRRLVSTTHAPLRFLLACAPRTDHSALVAKLFSFRRGQPSENQIVTGIAPILSSYRGLLRLRASRRFRSGFRLRAPASL